MKRHFIKMHGCGNDYIYFDCFGQPLETPETLSVRLSDRHTGIGGDGIVLIEPAAEADARMRMFNADGSEGNMCGNAIRCVGKYLYESGRARREKLTVATRSGVKTLQLKVEYDTVTEVTVDMGPACFAPDQIPVLFTGKQVVDRELSVGGTLYRVTCVSMGNPHCVVFGGDPVRLNLAELGPQFEHHPMFPQRVNTEFVQILDRNTLVMRVWERGSGETMACGTGTCAAVSAAVANGYCPAGEPITVHLRGGDLRVCYTEETVFMTGPAAVAFEGEVEL